MSRSEKSLKNITTAVICQTIGIIISFITRVVFIKYLGKKFLGLDGLFTNILTVLSLAELGVGEAITFGLYKPLAEKDEYRCAMLMQLYKKIYNYIGIFMLIIGASVIPFLQVLIKDIPSNVGNIKLIYYLFVINTATSYFFSYKRNLIIADQNRYIATIIRYSCYCIMNVIQIIFLVIFKNYILFLIVQILFTLIENIWVSIKANKMYKFLNNKEKIKTEKRVKDEIITNTKAMMMHKIGYVMVDSTDNIIISSFIGLKDVALYSNYYLIIKGLNTILWQFFSSLTASVGNLFAINNGKDIHDVFQKIDFACFWIYAWTSICLLCLFNDFINLWLGNGFLFDFNIVLVLVINFYINGMRKSVLMFKDAGGLFYKDRWKAILEGVLNIVVSVILAVKDGTLGVFIGTLISTILVCLWVESYILYKYGFKKPCKEYFVSYIKYLFSTIILAIITFYICNIFKLSGIGGFIYKLIVYIFIPNIIILLFTYKTDKFQYFYNKIFTKSKNKIFS